MLLGLILIACGGFFMELSTGIGKYQIMKQKESAYAMGFLSLISSWIFFGILILVRGTFGFDPGSIPSFSLRVGLEILQMYVSLKAIALASRSTYSFIHIGTVPILLLIDLFIINAPIGAWQIIGITAIVLAILILSMNHGIDKKGLAFVILSTVNGAATLTLFKYNISHFNTVEAEQFLLTGIILIYLGISAWKRFGENPLKLLRKPIFFAQSASYGSGIVLDSFAYLFAPTSLITTVKRAISIFWSVLSGHYLFKETKFITKLLCFALTAFGIVLIATTR